MIDIKTLPKIVRTQLRDDPFIFKASNDQQVNIEDLAAIVRSDMVTDVIKVLTRNEYTKRPFYLQHTDLFEKAQELFLSIFGVEPDLLIYSYKCDYSSSVFLFANEGLVETAKRKEEIEIIWKGEFSEIKSYERGIKKEESIGVKVRNVFVLDDTLKVKLPEGVFPVIGALNSLNSAWRTPNFNLIFGTDYLSSLDDDRLKRVYNNVSSELDVSFSLDSKKWIGNIGDALAYRFKYGFSLYSLDKFDFKHDSFTSEYYFPDSTEFLEKSLLVAKKEFVETIVQFLLATNRAAHLPLNREQFSSVMPHFYGFDRILGSVAEYDTSKKALLKRYYDTADIFSDNVHELTCKSFIDYFLRDSIINFEKLRTNPASEILKAFQKQPQIPLLTDKNKELFTRFITNGKPNSRYEDFLNGSDGQVRAKQKVYPLL